MVNVLLSSCSEIQESSVKVSHEFPPMALYLIDLGGHDLKYCLVG